MVRLIGSVLAIGCVMAAVGYREARQAPIVRHATIVLPHWPAGAPPVTVALIADIHMPSATMDEPRLHRIVDQTDALHPDLVAIAGDFIEGSGDSALSRALPALARQLAGLHAPLGTVAVLGNHDHWTDPRRIAAMLGQAHVTLLDNSAVERGPLAIGGTDDPATGHADVKRTAAAIRRLPGARIMIAHSPNAVRHLPGDVHLLLAGHTHCGQVVLPLIGAPIDVADPRYRCGLVRDRGRATIVTAGVGTSDLPIRIGAPPDIWLIRIEGAGSPARR